MAQADVDKKLEEKFKAANQKLEEIQKVTSYSVSRFGLACALFMPLSANANAEHSLYHDALGHRVFLPPDSPSRATRSKTEQSVYFVVVYKRPFYFFRCCC